MRQIVFLIITLLLPLASVPQSAPFDLLFLGVRFIDGTGNPWYMADVGVRDGKSPKSATSRIIQPSAPSTSAA